MPDRPPYHRQTLRVSRTLIPMLSKSLFLSVPMAPALGMFLSRRRTQAPNRTNSWIAYDFLEIAYDFPEITVYREA